MPEQRFTGGGRAHAALAAREQRDVDQRFEIGEPFADCGRRDELAFSRTRNRAFLADGDEQAQRHLIDLPHDGHALGI